MIEINYDILFEEIRKIETSVSPDYYIKTYPLRMEKSCRPYKVAIRTIVSNMIDCVRKFDEKSVVFIYPLERFFRLAGIIQDKYNILTFSNIFFNSITKKYENTKVLSNNNIQKGIFLSFKTHDMLSVQISLVKLEKILERNRVKLIILGNDWTFFERLCALAGKDLGIPVVTLQHGIYHRDTIRIMEFGKYSDQFWCWSDYVKENYEKYYKKENFVKVVGYPHDVIDEHRFINQNRVLFVSSPWLNDNRTILSEYELTIEKVIDACNILNKEFSFRLHPGESKDYWISRFSQRNDFHISTTPSLVEDVRNSGIVIGDLSSALLEANLLHKRAIQIKWHKEVEKYMDDELYDSLIKASNNVDDIVQAIKNNIGKYYDDRRIFYTVGNPGVFCDNVLNSIKEILASKSYGRNIL